MKDPITLSRRSILFFSRIREIHDQVELPEFDPSWMARIPVTTIRYEDIQSVKPQNRFVWLSSIAAALLVFLGGVFLYQNDPAPIAPAGMVVGLLGQVHIERDTQERPLLSGEAVFMGDRIKTEKNAYLNLISTEGHALQISPASSVRIAEQNGTESVFVEDGQVIFQIPDQAGGLRLESQGAALQAMKGSFVVEVEEESTVVLVLKGDLAVLPDSGGTGRTLFSGPALIGLARNGGMVRLQPDEELIAWVNEKDTELASLVNHEEHGILASLADLRLSRNDQDLIKKFGRKPGTIHLKNGNTIRGVVASSAGEKLLIETVGGARMIQTHEIEQFDYTGRADF